MNTQKWLKFFPILLLLWIGMTSLSYGNEWTPLYKEGEKTIYLDETTFESNRGDTIEGETYRMLFWLRYETLETESFLEQQYEVQLDRKTNAVRFRMTKSRYTGPDGTVAGSGKGGWERLKTETPEEKMIQRAWHYDATRSKTP